MKKTILLIAVIIGLITVANAQDSYKDKSPEERAKMQTEWMQKKLTLDSTVVTSVQTINLKYANKMEILKNNRDSRYAKIQEFKSLSDQKDKELKTVFTPEQYNLYLQKKDELKDYMRQNIRENQKNTNNSK